MRRWSWLKAVLLLLAVLVVVWGAFGWVVTREPAWYTEAVTVPPQADDPAVASDTQTRIGELVTALKAPYAAPGEWQASFSAAELNTFLREDDDHAMLLRPKWEGFSDPRVNIDGDRLRVGVRAGTAGRVLSVEVRAWLVKDEPNTLAIELVDVRLGGLPWFKQGLMERMTAFAAEHGADLRWYRGANNPVGVCRLQANQNQPDFTLTAVDIADGRVTVSGKGLVGP